MRTCNKLRALAERVPDTVGNQALRATMSELAVEVERIEDEIDNALAQLRAPDSTNDGGRANIDDELRTWRHNNKVAMDDLQRELDGLRSFKSSVDEALNSGDGTYRP